MGVVKTEVPIRVHWAKRKHENYFQYHQLPIVTNNFFKASPVEPELNRVSFILRP